MIYDEGSIRSNIQKFRLKSKLTQTQLARLIGISRTHVSDIERNSNIMPSMDVICKIAVALNISVDDLIQGTLNYYLPELEDKIDQDIIKSLISKNENELELILIFAKKFLKHN